MRSLLVSSALVLGALALPTVPAHAAAAACHGLQATIEGSTGSVVGTPGNDVIVVSGTVTHVDAGAGDDVVCVVDVNNQLSVSAGAGSDIVNTTETRKATFTDLGADYDHFLGGPGPDTVRSSGPITADVVLTRAGDDSVFAVGPGMVDLGTGDDRLVYLPTADGGYLNLGEGNDTVTVKGWWRNLQIDLHAQELRTETSDSVTRLRHAEGVVAAGQRVVVHGDGDGNDFRVGGCRVNLHGAGGNDRLAMIARDGSGARCSRHTAWLSGGAGNDSLIGYSGDDALLGGPGTDTAFGAAGTDRCVAEKKLKCER